MKDLRHHLCLRVGLAVAGIAALSAQAPTGQPPPLALNPAAIEAFVSSELAARELVGLSLAVVRDSAPILVKGFGTRSLSDGSAVTPETRFAIGSITKQFTSAAVLLLAEDGKLSPTDKIAKWYPNVTKANEIALIDLMNHVSGYPDYYPLDFVDRRMLQPLAVDEVIRQYASGALDFEPGTRYSYSNTGFLMLGRVVEKVSGEPFGGFLERHILRRLGMTNTLYEPGPRQAGLAQGYVTFALSPPEIATPEAEGWIAAAGGLWSTPADLAKWDQALMTGKMLTRESYRLMATPRTLADGSSAGYGCGLSISTRGGRTVLSHNGAVAGFYALNSMVPATRSAVILFSNLDSYDAVNAIYGRLMSAVLSVPVKTATPAIAGPPAADAAALMLASFQKGQVDRGLLGEEFSVFLTDARIRGSAERLGPYGQPTKVSVESLSERGGMEVARVRFTFASGTLMSLMYRTPDGKIQQFFVLKE